MSSPERARSADRPDSPGSRSWVSPTDRLTHVTLETGHVAVIARADVGTPAIRVLQPILRRALSIDSPVRLPAIARRYALRADVQSSTGVLLASVARHSDAHPVTTVVVAAHDDGSGWREMIEGIRGLSETPPLLSDRLLQIAEPPPPPPWMLTWAHPDAPVDALDWVADLDQCLAWAWIEDQVGARSLHVREPSPDGGLVDVTAAAPAAAEESGDDLPTRRVAADRLLAAARQSPSPATRFFAALVAAELARQRLRPARLASQAAPSGTPAPNGTPAPSGTPAR